MHKKVKIAGLIIAIGMGVSGCTGDQGARSYNTPGDKDTSLKAHETVSINAEFDADSAYAFVEKQVSFGPRVPGTPSHSFCGQWLIQKMQSYCDTVYLQDVKVSTKSGPMRILNIVGSFKPSATNRVVLAAHWDTRPHADEDLERPDEPADGANDGASGVGVLIEVARQLQKQNSNIGVDIIFFDAEDGGSYEGGMKSWCLGSQYWSINKHIDGYNARFGILLDMVGAKGATFPFEGHSGIYAGDVLLKVWRTAQGMGYGDHFLNIEGSMITDDHLFMNEGGIPTIDIIHYDFIGGGGFGEFWHTHEDNMDVIYKPTLDLVGMTVLQVVYNER